VARLKKMLRWPQMHLHQKELSAVEAQLLKGDSAIVTGAGVGIGQAIAEALAREGATVLLTDINNEACQTAALKLRNEGHEAIHFAADLSDPDAPARVFDAALKNFGRVSILVHCASPYHQEESVSNLAEGAWESMFNVNVKAGFRLAHLSANHMKKEGIRGRMVFITSLHAETPRGVPHYSVAKAGVTILVKELAKAYGPHGMRVNAIAPGIVAANWFASADALAKSIPMRRLGRPEEVAGTAVALLVDRFSGYINGTTVVVDGGLSLHNWIPDR
jgi:3-oxoacyl-[acyl-carrier protein] reductase